MSDVRSEPSLWTYLVLLIQSGIPPCSPNPLPMASKVNSTHDLLTYYTLVANLWLSMESFQRLSLSRLKCPQGLFWVQSYSSCSSTISLTFENPLQLFADDSTLCRDIPHPSYRQAAASSPSSDLDKSQAGQTLMPFNSDKSRTLTISLQKDHLANPLFFLHNPLEKIQSLKLMGFTISHDLSWANHI